MFHKKTKQKTKQSKNGENAVIGSISSRRFSLPGKKGLITVIAVTAALAGLGYYAFRTFRVTNQPAPQAETPPADDGGEVTPPGTIKVTPEVPAGIEHQERRPVAGG